MPLIYDLANYIEKRLSDLYFSEGFDIMNNCTDLIGYSVNYSII